VLEKVKPLLLYGKYYLRLSISHAIISMETSSYFLIGM
tara:strand:- start:11869 stop:11982 length:114 start_codon:yes stop_codon:yes gene_type:complete